MSHEDFFYTEEDLEEDYQKALAYYKKIGAAVPTTLGKEQIVELWGKHGGETKYNLYKKKQKEQALKKEEERIDSVSNVVDTMIITSHSPEYLSKSLFEAIRRIEAVGHSFEIHYSTVVNSVSLQRKDSYPNDREKKIYPTEWGIEYSALIIEYKRNPTYINMPDHK